MLHLLRILLIGLAVISITGYPLQTLPAFAGTDDTSSYQQRSEVLAKQLEQLRGTAVPCTADTPVETKISCTPEQQRQKEALLANALNALLVSQAEASPAVAVPYAEVGAPAILLNPRVSDEQGEAVAFLQMEEAPAVEEAPLEEPEAPAGGEEVTPVAPPAPPAPRVQSNDMVRQSQESLVGQLRGLMRAVSAGADPMDPVATAPIDAPKPDAPVSTAPLAETPGEAEDAVAPAAAPISRPRKTYVGDPLEQLVDVDFREVDLTNVVAILALKADLNIIAGTQLTGVVTANLRQVPLRVAMETALRMNGLGMVEEEGIYFIVPYEEAAAVNRKTTMLTMERADAGEIKGVLDEIVSGIRDEAAINISSNPKTNTLVISAPKNRVDELIAMAHQLDVAEPVLPTVTEVIALNYANPKDLMPIVQKMLSPKGGEVEADERASHLIVTDLPIVVEQVAQVVKKLDIATKQVLIETMVVDAVLSDEADTGVQWIIDSVQRFSRREAALGANGRAVGNLQELNFLSDLEALQNPAGLMNFGVLTGSIDWRGLIQLEVRNRNAHLVSNPILTTLENEPAEISISQEIPYIEIQQTGAGGSQTNTQFKEVGTVFTVTPKVSNDDTIITTIEGKESNLFGEFQGVPIEDKREVSSTMRMGNGQTIFVGGLRKNSATSSTKKIPVLGDVPVVNFLFRNNQRVEQINELMVFLTCTVVPDDIPELTPYQKDALEKATPAEPYVDAWESNMHEVMHPELQKNVQRQWRHGL